MRNHIDTLAGEFFEAEGDARATNQRIEARDLTLRK